jgi:energy-coupling factor transport system substrate-specific component
MSTSAVQQSSNRWTTSRLALVVVLGAINGALLTPIAMLWVIINSAFGVIGAALFQPFAIFTSLVAWLVPLPGVYLISNTVNGFANFLTGDPSGVATIYWGIAGGIAGEIALAIFRYNPKRRTAIVILAAALYIPFTNIVTFYLYGWESNLLLWIGLVLSIIAIIVESALPGIALAKWLRRTKLLRGLEVPEEP